MLGGPVPEESLSAPPVDFGAFAIALNPGVLRDQALELGGPVSLPQGEHRVPCLGEPVGIAPGYVVAGGERSPVEKLRALHAVLRPELERGIVKALGGSDGVERRRPVTCIAQRTARGLHQ